MESSSSVERRCHSSETSFSVQRSISVMFHQRFPFSRCDGKPDEEGSDGRRCDGAGGRTDDRRRDLCTNW